MDFVVPDGAAKPWAIACGEAVVDSMLQQAQLTEITVETVDIMSVLGDVILWPNEMVVLEPQKHRKTKRAEEPFPRSRDEN